VIEMELVGVRVELPSNSPIVLLREQTGKGRLLPIFIGGPEATAIALALEDVETPRPMTHDLMAILLGELEATVERIEVTELRDRTFYAEVHISHGEQAYTVSARPSDAIALAVRAGTPIFAAESVLDSAGYEATDEDDADGDEQPEEVVEQFRQFIDSVSPEDFDIS
jgi:bifunctional DNase/RNase